MKRALFACLTVLAVTACDEFATDADGNVIGNPVAFPDPQPLATTDGSPLPERAGVGVVTASASAMLPLVETLSGRTMSGTDQSFQLRSDGTYNRTTRSGDTFQGAWEIREGQFCWSDLTEDDTPGPATCKQIVLVLDQVTLFGGGTDLRTYTLS